MKIKEGDNESLDRLGSKDDWLKRELNERDNNNNMYMINELEIESLNNESDTDKYVKTNEYRDLENVEKKKEKK